MAFAIAAMPAAAAQARVRAVAPDVDGIVIRGAWRAQIALGPPAIRFFGDTAFTQTTAKTREGTTLTIVATKSYAPGYLPPLRVRLARIRGVTVSGAVVLRLDDSSDAPLFLDLSGTGRVRVTGTVPLVRVTTSGSVAADLSALDATDARVHARQRSRLTIHARDGLTIVALDSAHVTYSARRVHLTVRDSATLTPH